MESKFREALSISDGAAKGLFNEPLAVVIYAFIALMLVVPVVLQAVRKPPATTPVETEKENVDS